MKKQIIFAFFTSLVLMLSGCGSNDKVDGDSSGDASSKVVLDSSIESNTTSNSFSINMAIQKQISSDYRLTLKDFKLSVGGCEVKSVNVPDTTIMTGGIGSTANITFDGEFLAPCTPTDYKIQFEQITSIGDRSLSEIVTYDSVTGISSGGEEAPVNGFFQCNYSYADHSGKYRL